MSNLTRGPLPARVYWTRRLVVLGTALLLVVGLARLLSGGSDASSEPEAQAVRAAASEKPSADVPTLTRDAVPDEEKQAKGTKKKQKEPVLAEPTGTCVDSDVAVTPRPKRPFAVQAIPIVLKLQTLESEACTWEVSPESVTLKVTSGDDLIWTSSDCVRAVPTEDVVLRNNVVTKVEVNWHGRRSDDECSRLTQWALPGYYHVVAAALAGEPEDVQFELKPPKRPHVTKTVQPEPEPENKDKKNRDEKENKPRR